MNITNSAGASAKSSSDTVRPSTTFNRENSGAGDPKGDIVLAVLTIAVSGSVVERVSWRIRVLGWVPSQVKQIPPGRTCGRKAAVLDCNIIANAA
jgi:hypothetical protein